jgi:hypothetical protein
MHLLTNNNKNEWRRQKKEIKKKKEEVKYASKDKKSCLYTLWQWSEKSVEC